MWYGIALAVITLTTVLTLLLQVGVIVIDE